MVQLLVAPSCIIFKDRYKLTFRNKMIFEEKYIFYTSIQRTGRTNWGKLLEQVASYFFI